MTNGHDYAFQDPTFFGDGSLMMAPLTKREYFAAMAMQGMCADSETWEMTHVDVGAAAVRYADALIEALNK